MARRRCESDRSLGAGVAGYAAAARSLCRVRVRDRDPVTCATLRRSSHTFNANNAQSMSNRAAITTAERTIQGSTSMFHPRGSRSNAAASQRWMCFLLSTIPRASFQGTHLASGETRRGAETVGPLSMNPLQAFVIRDNQARTATTLPPSCLRLRNNALLHYRVHSQLQDQRFPDDHRWFHHRGSPATTRPEFEK
jgi:hypothetical protein